MTNWKDFAIGLFFIMLGAGVFFTSYNLYAIVKYQQHQVERTYVIHCDMLEKFYHTEANNIVK